jgi:hypothetical protein
LENEKYCLFECREKYKSNIRHFTLILDVINGLDLGTIDNGTVHKQTQKNIFRTLNKLNFFCLSCSESFMEILWGHSPSSSSETEMCVSISIIILVMVSEIGCPGARDICLTTADKYLPHFSCPPGIHSKLFAAACCSSKICWWWANSIFGGQVKFEILVAQGQQHHFWISETLHVFGCLIQFIR